MSELNIATLRRRVEFRWQRFSGARQAKNLRMPISALKLTEDPNPTEIEGARERKKLFIYAICEGRYYEAVRLRPVKISASANDFFRIGDLHFGDEEANGYATDPESHLFTLLLDAQTLVTLGPPVRFLDELDALLQSGTAQAILEKLQEVKHGSNGNCECPISYRSLPPTDPNRWWHDHHEVFNQYLIARIGQAHCRAKILRKLQEWEDGGNNVTPLFSGSPIAKNSDQYLRHLIEQIPVGHQQLLG